MKQISRINKYEKILNKGTKVISKLENLLIEYNNLQLELSLLSKYYASKEWINDFSDYENNKIKKSIKAGILSEDAIYNLLDDNKELAMDMKKIATDILKK